MGKRRTLIVRTVIGCSVPVVAIAAWILFRPGADDVPYVAGGETEGITRALDRRADDRGGALRFVEITGESGIDFTYFPFVRTSQIPEDMGPGAAWGDYDGDGLDDLFLPNFAAPLGVPDEEMSRSAAHDRLYRNRGDGTFEDVTAAAGVGRAHRALGAAWGDWDADGDPDLVVTGWGENVLWENRGDGTFVDATARAGLAGAGFWTGASWADPDLDGDLDLYICGYVAYVPPPADQIPKDGEGGDFPFTLNPSSWPPHPNQFWVNQGDGRMVERAEAAGIVGREGRSFAGAWFQYDDDGRPDLYVSNDVSDNTLFRNLGDGTFANVSYEAVVADYRGARGSADGDGDGDLDLDLFVSHWIAQENALYSSLRTDMEGGEGGGMFVDEADRVGLGQIALDLIGWGAVFEDFDLDGRLDLFVANGSTFQDRQDPRKLVAMVPHLYWNAGPDEGFFEVGEAAGVRSAVPGVGRGVAVADWDADGDSDILVCRHGTPHRLLRNDSVTGHGIRLRLTATTGHPEARGALVTVWAGGVAQRREVGAGPSYLSGSGLTLLVGLGAATAADSVIVEWLGGAREVVGPLAADRVWRLVEGEGALDGSLASPRLSTGRAVGDRRETDLSENAVRADVSTALDRAQIRRFWALKRDADRALVAGEWEKAIGILAELSSLDPTHLDSWYERGNCRLELGQFRDALGCWEMLLRLNPSSSRAWLQIGHIHLLPEAGDLYDPGRAAEAFRRAHELNREESGPLILWGQAALAGGDPDAALELFDTATRMNDQATEAFLLGGYIHWQRREMDLAHRRLRSAAGTLKKESTIEGTTGEGDTRDDLAASRRAAASRRPFALGLESLRRAGPNPDPATVYAGVERARAELPEWRGSVPRLGDSE